MPAQQAPQPAPVRGRGRGGANVVAERGGRQPTPPPQQTVKKLTFQQPSQTEVKKETNPLKVGPNPFLQNQFLPDIQEISEEIEIDDIDNMTQEELDEIRNQLDQELEAEFQEELLGETQ